MTGVRLRIRNTPRPPESYFAAFFAPVLPHLGHLTWLLDIQAFRIPLDLPNAELEAFENRQQWVAAEGGPHTGSLGEHYVADPGFVADYAAWVSDDWNSLYGFDRPPADWRGWLRAGHKTGPQWQTERAADLASGTAVCFFAVDYVFWEFFARDARLVRIVSESALANGRPVEPASLFESAGLGL
ncbi:MAG: hypothetical protein ACRC7O_16515 [Fimbriiglobus sp.]